MSPIPRSDIEFEQSRDVEKEILDTLTFEMSTTEIAEKLKLPTQRVLIVLQNLEKERKVDGRKRSNMLFWRRRSESLKYPRQEDSSIETLGGEK